MENLNAEQVKKALECFHQRILDTDLAKKVYEAEITAIIDALALIKELTEDNEYLKTQLTATEARAESRKESDLEEVLGLRLKVEELTEENERLRCEVADLQDELKCEKETNEHLCGEYMSAKADTVRKMQERLTKEFDRMHKSNFITVEVRQWIIDQIAKEMVEGKNES